MKEITTWNVLEHMLPNCVRYILVKYPGTILAGGAVLSMMDDKPVNDWDIFVKDKKTIDKIFHEYLSPEKIAHCKILRQSNVRGWFSFMEFLVFGQKIQLIYKPWDTPGQILDDFDFEVAKFAISFDTKFGSPKMKLHYTSKAIDDLKNRRITIAKIKRNLVNELNRIRKYQDKGFTIDNQQWITFFKKVQEFSSDDLDAGILNHMPHDGEHYEHLKEDFNKGVILTPSETVTITGEEFEEMMKTRNSGIDTVRVVDF